METNTDMGMEMRASPISNNSNDTLAIWIIVVIACIIASCCTGSCASITKYTIL